MDDFFASRRLRAVIWPAGALVLLVLGWLDLSQHYATDADVTLALTVLRVAPLLWCRSRPLLAWSVSFAAVVVTAVVTRPVSVAEPWPWGVTSLAAYLTVMLAAASRVGRPLAVGLGAAFTAATAVLLVLFPTRGDWTDLLVAVVGVGIVLAAAEVLRDRDRTRRRLAEQERISEAERTKRALLEERARIGRELHDVVAHHMSLIAVRAETAPYRLPDTSGETHEEFKAISGAAREALTDMRRLLGLLRGEGTDAERAPQPALDDVAALVAEAGSGVRLDVVGDVEGVPPTVGLCAYRVLQESLSNARRHAPGALVEVRLHRSPDLLRLSVDNGPAVGQPLTLAGSGHGVMGMRERVTLLGGEFSARTTQDGGYRVAVSLPLRGV
ncbi:sensor histidine kinase [Streptomyces sp. SAJ15]|uniref:sensor histidine kinase n=1 Tax=Streptomyces sp. SAJ15 TaxID=2011095 RepID=UPI001184BE1B|nr:histidine kinase [Streptomyces sp. SAJ15]TVL88666.1 two-component sensor histidine kinase [Streptomyces sp. SAJ15]